MTQSSSVLFCSEALRSKVIIIVVVVACLAAFVASQEEVACQEETCLASFADILVAAHHTAQEEVACLPAQTTRLKRVCLAIRHLPVQERGYNTG